MENKNLKRTGEGQLCCSQKVLRIIIISVLLPFTILTAATLWKQGFIGLFAEQLSTFSGWQVWIDLVIALTLFMVWMWNDAKKAGRNPLPYIVITLIAGSFGPLFYLLFRKSERN